MGNSEVGPPEPRRRPGGAAGPRADLPEHPERRVLPAPALGRAVRHAPADRRHAAPRRPARPGGVHALDRHLLACVELGVRHRVPAIAIHGFLDGRDSAPTLGAEVVRTLLLDMRRIAGHAGGHRLAHRPLLRHGPGPALGPHPAGLRRHGARHRHAGGAPGARRAGRLPARRDRRVHPAAGASPERRAGRDDARRRRRAVLQLPQRPHAPDRARAGARRLRRLRPRRPARRSRASR